MKMQFLVYLRCSFEDFHYKIDPLSRRKLFHFLAPVGCWCIDEWNGSVNMELMLKPVNHYKTFWFCVDCWQKVFTTEEMPRKRLYSSSPPVLYHTGPDYTMETRKKGFCVSTRLWRKRESTTAKHLSPQIHIYSSHQFADLVVFFIIILNCIYSSRNWY